MKKLPILESLLQIDPIVKNEISVEQAWYYHILPLTVENGTLKLAVDEKKFDEGTENELTVILGKRVCVQPFNSSVVEELLVRHYPTGHNGSSNLRSEAELLKNEGGNFLTKLIAEAKTLRSSDIHIESYGERARIRFRVDGVLIDRHKIERGDYPAIVNKIKIAASCDIAEKRLPQDGRVRWKHNGDSLDIRVSILPTLFGEKIVLRLLGSDSSHISLDSLGFGDTELASFKEAVGKKHGIILISGPTGSGKTTTLYATLKLLNGIGVNITTIEDPVEYTLDGVNQVQLKEEIGLTYAEALRTFLRQDPDVIMLGEIRDSETAQMAIRASLTGHLVLSTIHTNSAWGTISRLEEMGLPSYLLANTINLSVAQRLIRRLCVHCKTKTKSTSNEVKLPGYVVPDFVYLPSGCDRCHYTGYKGRIAIYEVVAINDEAREFIKTGNKDYSQYMKKNKIASLAERAFGLFSGGESSFDEVYPYLIT